MSAESGGEVVERLESSINEPGTPPTARRKPRLAVCIRHFTYGGQGVVVEEELKYLRDEFSLVLLAEQIGRDAPLGVDAFEVGTWSNLAKPNERLLELFSRVDLIHCHDSLGFMNAARCSGRPFVVTAHGIAPLRLRSSILGIMEGAATLVTYPRLYRSAAAVVAISDYIARWLKDFSGVEPWVIRHGAGPVAERVVRPDRRSLLYVGEVSRRKGLSDLISGLSEIPTDITLDIVGRGDIAKFSKFAKRQGVADRVHFHGEVDHARLEAAYRHAWCTVSASRWEGFGLPILEGFRFGRPALVRRHTGLEELVTRSEAGSFFADSEELAQAIESVGQHWDPLSRRALAFAKAYTWGDAFAAYRRLFHSLLNRG
jgi:glycosyltransferase involved in cell wall biosynthesis